MRIELNGRWLGALVITGRYNCPDDLKSGVYRAVSKVGKSARARNFVVERG